MTLRFKRRMPAACISFLAVLILRPCAICGGDLKCGDELRVETISGSIVQGKVHQNNTDSLLLCPVGKSEVHKVALSDVSKLYRVKRNRGQGIVMGFLVCGGLSAAIMYFAFDWGCRSDEGSACLDKQIFQSIMTGITVLTCGIIGAVIGAGIGYKDQILSEVPLDKLPICISPSADMTSLSVNVSVSVPF